MTFAVFLWNIAYIYLLLEIGTCFHTKQVLVQKGLTSQI